MTVQASSVGGGEIRVNAIDGLEAGFSGHENTIVLTYADTRGMIAAISKQVSEAHLNIATMRVFRDTQGGKAIELDGEAPDELLQALAQLRDVYRVAYLPAAEENASCEQ